MNRDMAYKVSILAIEDLIEIIEERHQKAFEAGLDVDINMDTSILYLEALRMAANRLRWERKWDDHLRATNYNLAAALAFKTWKKKEPVFEHEVYGPTCLYCDLKQEKVDLGWRRREKIIDPSFPNERVFEYRFIHEEDCPHREFEELVGVSQKENTHEELD